METLYKKDTKGNVRYLKVWSEGATIFNESGLIGTDSPVTHTKEAKGKNIGRSNETSPTEQAISEVTSYIKKKLDEGYFKTQAELDEAVVILPMLAKDYSKEKHKINWNNSYAEFKYDGLRCLAFIKNGSVILMSRKGKIIENMMHIEKSLLSLYPDSCLILDGELYAHDIGGFQTNMSYVKKYREGLSELIKFNVYDIVNDEGQADRFETLDSLKYDDNVVKVHYRKVNNEEELKQFHSQCISLGFEGTMVRWGNEKYKINGRSSNLLKYKDFIDSTATIVDIIPAEQRPDWGVPVFDGFKAGVKLSHEERVDLLLNKKEYIGKTAELRYFELTDDGKPRFPIMVGIRLDK